jgi:hypothetical protein
MIDTTNFVIFLLIVDAIVVIYNFYLLMKVQHNVKKIPTNNATGIACEYLELRQLIPINLAITIINILFVVLK